VNALVALAYAEDLTSGIAAYKVLGASVNEVLGAIIVDRNDLAVGNLSGARDALIAGQALEFVIVPVIVVQIN
jgi:hypothetical protein